MSKIKHVLKQRLQGQLSHNKTQSDINNTYSVFEEAVVSFSLFCADNYIYTYKIGVYG